MKFLYVLTSFMAAALFVLPCSAQMSQHFNFGGGVGFTIPTGVNGDNLDTGWNLGLRGGFNLNSHLLADLDFAYNRWSLNSSALARFAEPGGYTTIWSLTFNPVVRLAPSRRLDPYITAGYGLYHRNLTLTRPALVPVLVCDPFFGFCFVQNGVVNQVVASSSTLKTGYNAGGGVEFGIGEGRMKVFGEVRYHQMFTNHGSDLTYIPVTFGVRW